MDVTLYQQLLLAFAGGCAKAVGAGVLCAIFWRIKI